MFERDIRLICERDPELAGLLADIRRLAEAVTDLPFEAFREPVAVLNLREKHGNVLLNLDAWYLTCWCQHMAYSMRVRMQTLEPGILAELAEGRLLSAQVLLRAHLEAAAMAALCTESLRKSKSEPDWETLRELIPKTLFGTALSSKSVRDERLVEMLSWAEQRTITICRAIDALEAFTYQHEASGQLTGLYGLLCEASHPNHRGTRGFMKAAKLDEHAEYGWCISYSSEEAPETIVIQRLIEALLVSMRQGYSASELLRLSGFADENGHAVWLGVPKQAAHRIWTSLLQRGAEARSD